MANTVDAPDADLRIVCPARLFIRKCNLIKLECLRCRSITPSHIATAQLVVDDSACVTQNNRI